MTIEVLLERIAVALEKRNTMGVEGLVKEVTKLNDKLGEKPVPGNNLPAPKEAEKPKKPRGRPAKMTEDEKKSATDAEIVVKPDPTATIMTSTSTSTSSQTSETAKPATVDELRDLMGKYRAKFHAQDKEGGTSKTQDELEKFTATILRGGVGVRALKDIPAEHFGAVRDYFSKVIA